MTFPLVIRKWREGDFFTPLGMKGKKKISDFLRDIKISPLKKKDVFVLISQNDIIWVIGYRINNLYKVTTNTKKVYVIELLNN